MFSTHSNRIVGKRLNSKGINRPLTHDESLVKIQEIMDSTQITPTGAFRMHITAADLECTEVIHFLESFGRESVGDEPVVIEVHFNQTFSSISAIAERLNSLRLTKYFIIEPLNLSVLAKDQQEVILDQIA